MSLLDFQKSNINGASPDALSALGQYDSTQQQNITDYHGGRGQFEHQGPGFFRDLNDVQSIAGPGGNADAFGTTISALRIIITVHEGKSEFKTAAVVAMGNDARVVQQKAQKKETSSAAAQTAAERQSAPDAAQANGNAANSNAQNANQQNLRYPFTLLEIRENDEIPSPSVENAPS